MAGERGPEDEVNWNGILEPEERRRILARIHSAMGAVGARMPEEVEVGGRRLRLKDAVFAYLDKERLTAADIEAVDALSAALRERAGEIETSIAGDDITEDSAIGLMREVLGILRALDHLRKLRDDPGRAKLARATLMERVDDERRWLEFIRKVR
jgi:hypothetical protein